MHRFALQYLLLVSSLFVLPLLSISQPSTTTISSKTSGMLRFDGFIPFYWDAKEGKVWLEISRFDEEFLYIHSLPAGVGSNDIGLDRGQLGGQKIVSFYRSGPAVLLVEPNYRFRATTTNVAERRAVRDAFATSVLWGFTIAAEENGRVLLDATAFFLRDAHDVVGALKRTNQGSYKLESSRSAFFLPSTKNFPLNTEVEAILTFTGDQPGGWLRSVVPSPQAVTVRQRHSMVHLPDDNFVPREFDPRGGFFAIQFADYAVPIGESLTKRFIARHRLNKKDPSAAMGEAVKPIVYYLDPGTPEPVRSALLDGARWWNEAFEAAGFRNAYRVEVLPDDADPMDVRYNMIQWVHRSTRGWSYGASVIDPRTGEIIKGHVSLGSLRVRQDYLLAEGLLSPYVDGAPVPSDMLDMALARLRQLSAHEVGHTLGLAHNYIASTMRRASVMDYPHPLATLHDDGSVDLSDAYAQGIGEWDKVAIAYGYREYPADIDERDAGTRLLQDAIKRGLVFLSDQDARPEGSAHPQTHLWDNGEDPAEELSRIMKVRHAALGRFSERVIQTGMPMATLEEALVPLYLSHRYQVEATAKSIGGVWYTYALRGDGQIPTTPVPPADQRRALTEILKTVTPSTLVVSEQIARLIPPRPYGFWRHRELFDSRTGVVFDRLSPVEAASSHVFRLLLNGERATRLVQQSALRSDLPGLAEVLEAIVDATWKQKSETGLNAEVQRTVQGVMLEHLFALAANESVSQQVRAVATLKVKEVRRWLSNQRKSEKNPSWKAQREYALDRIDSYLKDPGAFRRAESGTIPPGQPIGIIDERCAAE